MYYIIGVALVIEESVHSLHSSNHSNHLFHLFSIRVVLLVKLFYLFLSMIALHSVKLVKRKSLVIFSKLEDIDLALETLCGIKFNYAKRFKTNIIIAFVYISIVVSSIVNNIKIVMKTNSFWRVLFATFATMSTLEIWLIFTYIIMLSNELRTRLKAMNDFTESFHAQKVFKSKVFVVMKLNDLSHIKCLVSSILQNMEEFFGAEILLILGNLFLTFYFWILMSKL